VFERFTDQARRVVVLAQEEARLLNHSYIGTEHLLLGLIRTDEGVAAEALQSLGVTLELVRAQVEENVGYGQHDPSGHIPFTRRAKTVLDLSLRESLQPWVQPGPPRPLTSSGGVYGHPEFGHGAGLVQGGRAPDILGSTEPHLSIPAARATAVRALAGAR
jgi:hypothetical protein